MSEKNSNTDIGLNAARKSKEDELDDFVSQIDSVFGTPSEQQAQQEKPVEEPETTAAGVAGSITRGLAPYAIAGAAASPVGLLGGPLAEVTVPMAFMGGAASLALSNLAMSVGKSLTGINFKTPSEVVETWLDYAGVPDAKTNTEKLVKSAADAAGSGFGTASVLGKAAEFIKPSVAKGVLQVLGEKPVEQALATGASKAAEEYAKQQQWKVPVPEALSPYGITPESTAQTGAALLGGLAISPFAALRSKTTLAEVKPPQIPELMIKASRGDKSAQQELARIATTQTPEAISAQKATGIELPTEMTTAVPELRQSFQPLTSVAYSKTKQAQEKAISDLEKKYDEVMSEIGATKDLTSLSTNVRNKFQKTINDFKNIENKTYSDLESNIPPETPVNPTETIKAVENVIKRYGGKTRSLSQIEKDILFKLKENPTFGELQKLKQQIGDKTTSSKIFRDASEGEINHYYGLLRQDVINALDDAGLSDEAKRIWKVTERRKTLEDRVTNLFGDQVKNKLEQIVSKKPGEVKLTGTMEEEIGKISKQSSSDIVNLFSQIPTYLRPQVAASAIQSASTKEGVLDVPKFINWYSKIKSQKEAYNSLFGHLPENSKKQIDNLYEISKNINKSIDLPVNTPEFDLAIKNANNMAYKFRQTLKQAAMGLPFAVAAGAVHWGYGLAAELGYLARSISGIKKELAKPDILKKADEYLKGPEFAQLVKSSSSVDPAEYSKVVTKAINTPYLKKLFDELKLTNAQRISVFMPEQQQEQQ